jgi:hypothetical protein
MTHQEALSELWNKEHKIEALHAKVSPYPHRLPAV